MNDGKDVEGASNQLIRCIFCYVNPKNVPNPRTKNKKVLSNVWYNCLKKHVDVNHSIIAKKTWRKS